MDGGVVGGDLSHGHTYTYTHARARQKDLLNPFKQYTHPLPSLSTPPSRASSKTEKSHLSPGSLHQTQLSLLAMPLNDGKYMDEGGRGWISPSHIRLLGDGAAQLALFDG